ncbi:hypothetical protein BD289DRAFT_497460 [Coniella lustricola]|uniref:Uncharacterized protein n=1 Tax=Coniella lustricola TaxID=2025994 RepID=A0A2T2ZS97_9PEZI|nr:hypothetical protein BD289DRAFT_497460 [Coniella lustricola]
MDTDQPSRAEDSDSVKDRIESQILDDISMKRFEEAAKPTTSTKDGDDNTQVSTGNAIQSSNEKLDAHGVSRDPKEESLRPENGTSNESADHMQTRHHNIHSWAQSVDLLPPDALNDAMSDASSHASRVVLRSSANSVVCEWSTWGVPPRSHRRGRGWGLGKHHSGHVSHNSHVASCELKPEAVACMPDFSSTAGNVEVQHHSDARKHGQPDQGEDELKRYRGLTAFARAEEYARKCQLGDQPSVPAPGTVQCFAHSSPTPIGQRARRAVSRRSGADGLAVPARKTLANTEAVSENTEAQDRPVAVAAVRPSVAPRFQDDDLIAFD